MKWHRQGFRFWKKRCILKLEINALVKHRSWMQYEEIDETIDLEPMREEFQKQLVQEFYEKKQRGCLHSGFRNKNAENPKIMRRNVYE